MNKYEQGYEDLKAMEKELNNNGVTCDNKALGQQVRNTYKFELLEEKAITLSFVLNSHVDILKLKKALNSYYKNQIDEITALKQLLKDGIIIKNAFSDLVDNIENEYFDGVSMVQKAELIEKVVSCLLHFNTFCQLSDYIKIKQKQEESRGATK